MRKLTAYMFTIVTLLMFAGIIAADVAEARSTSSSVSSSASSAARSSSVSSSSAARSTSSSSTSRPTSSSSSTSRPAPKTTVTKTTPSGKSYAVPKTVAKSKTNPYAKSSAVKSYRGHSYADSHYSISNFWLWAFLFHPTGESYEDCDREDLQSGDEDCQYAYEYGGETNNSGGGWALTILMLFGIVALVGVLVAYFTRDTSRYRY